MYGWFEWVVFYNSRGYVYVCVGWVFVGSLFLSWCWVPLYFYYDAYDWMLIDAVDLIGLRRLDIGISGKFGIIRLDILILAYDLLIISIFDRIEVYC